MKPSRSSSILSATAIAAFAVCTLPTTRAQAALIIEPVFNRVAGSGQADNNFPIYDPGFLINGIAYFTADEPGEITTYASGDPRDPFLDEFHAWNNTNYDITSFTLRLIGTATDTEDPGTVVRGPVDAIWGDVDGDGLILSDIFSSITISADGKEIIFSGGLLPVGGRFTDIHLAVSDNPPDLAGIDSFFDGVLAIPEPSTLALAAIAAAITPLAIISRRARKQPRTTPGAAGS